jgi:CMP-N,N'-diacetyllegionaminic acid synthase
MINNKKILAVTLARGGSVTIKKKNIVNICGKPLLQYTTEEVKKSKYIDRYIVSTDDDDIKEVCNSLNVEYYNRSDEFAQATSKSADSLIEVINGIEEKFDYIVEIFCTNPLKTVEDIDGCIEKIENTDADSVVAVVRIWDHHPSRAKYVEDDLLKDFYPEPVESRRQDLTPPAYVRNGSIYITPVNRLLKYRDRLTGILRPYIMKEEKTVNIDEPIDLEMARILLQERDGV